MLTPCVIVESRDYGPSAKVSYTASGMHDWRFNGIQWCCEGVCLPVDEQCVVTRQEEDYIPASGLSV